MQEIFDRDSDGTPVFVIGLTMAGAISAGAYTAGVVDYLMRAMYSHNARVGTPGGPKHKVMLKAISGASAGGMCAGLIATNLLAVGRNGEPDWSTPQDLSYPAFGNGEVSGKLVLKRIFDTWVNNVRMWDEGSQTGLLAMEDLETDRKTLDQEAAGLDATGAISVLNGHHLDDVARQALVGIKSWTGGEKGYDFISSQLDLFLTTTAINPTVYQVTFGGGDPFLMSQHGIVRHFRFNGLGEGPALPSPWLDAWGDDGVQLDPRQSQSPLPLDRSDGGNWTKLTVASLATGAFPLALAPRVVDTSPWEMGALDGNARAQGGALPYDLDPKQTARPFFGETDYQTQTPYIALDGGAIDNEPFAHARYAIRQAAKETDDGPLLRPNPRKARMAHRAVLMVDPFPEGDSFAVLPAGKLHKMLGIAAVAKKLQKTFTGQARFKPAELLQAQDPDVHSRFLITPSRSKNGKTLGVGASAIACGLLGGFGGFLDRCFRQHDFVLGQRNCQRFLQKHFVLDPANPVLGLSEAEQQAGAPVPIISHDFIDPQFAKVELHDWMRAPKQSLNEMSAQLDRRLKRLAKVEIDKLGLGGWVIGPALKFVWTNGLGVNVRSAVMQAARRAVLSDLVLRDQHAEFAGLSMAKRVLVAGLIRCGTKGMSAEELRDFVFDAQHSEELTSKLPLADLPPVDEIKSLLKRLEEQGYAKRTLRSIIGKPRYVASV